MSEHRIYRVTSLGRPVEPKYGTNKAILILMPVSAVTAGVVTSIQGNGVGEATVAALQAFLIVFACWALGRELAPDDNAAAFVGTTLAFVSLWWWPSPSLLLLFTALALSRIVNRSTGLTARLSDSSMVTALVIWPSLQVGDDTSDRGCVHSRGNRISFLNGGASSFENAEYHRNRHAL